MRDGGSDQAMAEEARKQFGLGSLLAVWSRRKWLAIPAFVGPVAVAMSLVAFLPNLYQSTATVLVDRQQVPEAFVRSTVTSELETRLRSISQEILSRGRLDSVINRFGLYAKLRAAQPPEAIIERMREDIRLDLRGSDQERQVSQFKRRNIGELPQQMETTLGIIDRLDAQLRLNLDNQGRLRERRETLAKRGTQMPMIPDDRTGSSGDRLGLP